VRFPTGRNRIVLAALIAVGAIIAAAGIVTEAQGNLFWLYGQPTGGCPAPYSGSGDTPLDTSAALNTPMEQVRGPNHWYNFSVQSAGGGMTWGEIGLQVVTSTGSNVTPTDLWSAVALGLTGSSVATYSFSSGTGTTGSSAPFLSSQTLVLDSGTTNLSAVGDSLNVVGMGCFQGSISIAIP
jgi:hypothetical protein